MFQHIANIAQLLFHPKEYIGCIEIDTMQTGKYQVYVVYLQNKFFYKSEWICINQH